MLSLLVATIIRVELLFPKVMGFKSFTSKGSKTPDSLIWIEEVNVPSPFPARNKPLPASYRGVSTSV